MLAAELNTTLTKTHIAPFYSPAAARCAAAVKICPFDESDVFSTRRSSDCIYNSWFISIEMQR